jgi:group I intron endonuclease
MSWIYKITCIGDNKVYVGSTHNIKRRWQIHRDTLKRNVHHNSYLQYAWNKYGKDSFKFEILEIVSFNEYREKEQYWIDFYQAADRNHGFNNMDRVLPGSKTYSYLKESEVIEIIQALEQGSKKIDLAVKYEISQQTISDIAAGRSWAYLKRGKIRWNSINKIPDEDIGKIKGLYKNGMPQSKIAEIYHVNQSTINRIINEIRRKVSKFYEYV